MTAGVTNELFLQYKKEDVLGTSDYCKLMFLMSLDIYLKMIVNYQNKGLTYEQLNELFKFEEVRKCVKHTNFYKELEIRNVKPDVKGKGLGFTKIGDFIVGINNKSTYTNQYNLSKLKNECNEDVINPLPTYNFALLLNQNNFLFLGTNNTILYL